MIKLRIFYIGGPPGTRESPPKEEPKELKKMSPIASLSTAKR